MKRSYFGRDTEERVLLGGGVEAMKGVYQSIRAAEVFVPIHQSLDEYADLTFRDAVSSSTSTSPTPRSGTKQVSLNWLC